MRLSDNEIRQRLTSLREVGDIPPNFLELVRTGKIPHDLEQALKKGSIIIDPPVSAGDISSSSVDLNLGRVVEMVRIPLEVATIDGQRVIRRMTVDFRRGAGAASRLLEAQKSVHTLKGGSWIRFMLDDGESFELPPQLLVNAFTQHVVCVPDDLECTLQGRSSLAREGIETHITSDRFDAGFIGFMNLEVLNQGQSNFTMFPGMGFAAIGFTQLSSPATVPYYRKPGARFSGQT